MAPARLTTAAGFIAGVAWTMMAAAPAKAEEAAVRLELASTFPSDLPLIGEGAVRVIEQIERASAGELIVELHEPGELVPAAETVEAVAEGRIAAAWAGAGWFAERDSAFNMFSTVPFGPGMGEYMAWMYHGGGLEHARELFHAYGVHNIPCTVIPPEASGWFQQEIRSLDDLRGLRMRFFGLGAKVMERLGVVTQQLPPGQIRGALERGAIDATEFSLPSMDILLGLHDAVRYYYFPGWHQQATFFDLYINEAVWDRLSERHQVILELACGDNVREMIALGEASQWQALQEMQSQGVELRRWSPQILVALQDAWDEIVAEESAKNPNFRRVYKSYAEFRSNYELWNYLSYLQ